MNELYLLEYQNINDHSLFPKWSILTPVIVYDTREEALEAAKSAMAYHLSMSYNNEQSIIIAITSYRKYTTEIPNNLQVVNNAKDY